ncbi:MAG: sigma-70 family RNA polymerase sigma factor [Candidatus Zixiibacteriota bacterium]|nr:MAG: sigma-70 family RNA polymerase sigma factor [candidate division Zixibacteria bacterium]
MVSDVDDSQLVANCLKGNSKAFDRLIERYQKTIFNAAYQMVNDFDEAEDICQNAFVKAYENLERYDSQYKFFSWIYKIMVNEAINQLNRRSQFAPLDASMASLDKTPEEVYRDERLAAEVQDLVAELTIDYRVAIVLKHFVSLSYRDMSFILDIPEKTVKSRLYSARQMLSRLLNKNGIRLYD